MTDRIRIDKWLWHARFYRTRALARDAAHAGLIRRNGLRVEKCSVPVALGDILTLPRGSGVIAVRVTGLAERRGASDQARLLYEVLPEPVLDRSVPTP